MELNKENLEKIFNFIDNQISDVNGEFDEETPILTAVERTIEMLLEVKWKLKTGRQKKWNRQEN